MQALSRKCRPVRCAGLSRCDGRPRRQGVFITTGTFTREAEREATRSGAPPIDLIDGDKLCDLLKEHGLGVGTRSIEEVTIDRDWLETL